MRRLRSPSGAARLRPHKVRTRFCGAKPCFGGIHFRQRMVNRGPHETGFMGQAILWKPSPWRKFPSKRGECHICTVSGRLPAQHGCARRSCVQGFCGAKPCFGGIHFRQRMVNRGPHETGFMGQAIWWKPSPWRKFPSKRGRVARGERYSASTGLSADSSQVAVGSRDTTQEPPPDAL